MPSSDYVALASNVAAGPRYYRPSQVVWSVHIDTPLDHTVQGPLTYALTPRGNWLLIPPNCPPEETDACTVLADMLANSVEIPDKLAVVEALSDALDASEV